MKDFKFNKFNFLRFGFFLSWVAAFVMVTSPLAMAEQSKNLNKEMIVGILKEMGVTDNKDITMGEVWKRIRHKFTPEMRLQLDLSFQIYKDEKFPRLDISEVKNSSGETVVALNVTDGTDTARVELAGKENNFIKFNGKVITAEDVAGLDGFFAKIQDEKIIKKDQQRYFEALQKQPVFPTFEIWKKMTPYERAHYLVQVRLMMREVNNVLSIHESTKKPTESSQLEKDFNLYFKLLFGQDAEAAPKKERKLENKGDVKNSTDQGQVTDVKTTKTDQKGQKAAATDKREKSSASNKGDQKVQQRPKALQKAGSSSKSQSKTEYKPAPRHIAVGASCIVGGYPSGRMLPSGICTLNDKDGKLDTKYTKGCSLGGNVRRISCNPVLYGNTRKVKNPSPICVDYSKDPNSETQVATTADGVCEAASPLKNAEQMKEMIYSLLNGEMSDPDFEKSFRIENNKVNVSKEAYERFMTGPEGMLTKFANEKKVADEVCNGEKGIYKNSSSFELPSTLQQTKACDALLKRTIDLQRAVDSFITQTGPVQGPELPPCPPTAPTPISSTAPPVLATAPTPTAPPVLPSPTDQTTAPIGCCAHHSTCNPIASGVVVDGDYEGEGAVGEREQPAEKKSGGMPLWAKIGLIGLGIGSLTVLGLWLSGFWDKKKKKATYVPPYVPAQPSALPVSTPTPAPPKSIMETPEGAPLFSPPATR